APQTIWIGLPSPVSTMQTRRRSAFGCCTAEITDTTLNASYCFALSSTPSTSRPIIVSLSVISDSDASVSRCSFSQVRVNFIARLLSRRPEIKNRQHKEDDGEH